MPHISYKTTTAQSTSAGNPSTRTIHILVVGDEILTTTRQKEVMNFVKDRNPSRKQWRDFKEAVRLQKIYTSSEG